MSKGMFFKTKGMLRDLAASAFNSEFAYENMNMRILPNEDNTLLGLTNEKGTLLIEYTDKKLLLPGTIIGQAVINNSLILFGIIDNPEDNKPDVIYKITDNGSFSYEKLYKGKLGFNIDNPIETTIAYENEELLKVYWTDGLNQPRVINIAAKEEDRNKWTDSTFDFVRDLQLTEKVDIERDSSSGMFAPGTILYAFTYLSKYGQESNIFYTSPLLYTSYNERGGSPEDKVSNSFNITIEDIDPNFDYVRIYSILKTSINGTPEVKRVAEVLGSNCISSKDWKGQSGLNMYQFKNDHITENDITLISNSKETTLANSGIDPVEQLEGILTYKQWIIHDISIDPTPVVYYNVIYTDDERLQSKDSIFFFTSIKKLIKVNGNPIDGPFFVSSYSDFTIIRNYYGINYTDSGTTGEAIDPTQLLYIGGELIKALTMNHKDGTLFLGNISLLRDKVDKGIKETIHKIPISFKNAKKLVPPKASGYYSYDNQLKYDSSKIKFFKYLEWYRFGIQFQHVSGKWSEVVWVNDVKNNTPISSTFYNDTNVYLPIAESKLEDTSTILTLISQGYTKVRPVVVYPNINDRECICQGILCPTVYNVLDRFTNSPFALSSWFTRPNAPFDLVRPKETYDYNIEDSSYVSVFSRGAYMSNDNKLVSDGTHTVNYNVVNKGAWAEFRHNKPVPSNTERNAEILCIGSAPEGPYITRLEDSQTWVSENSENYFIDLSIVTMHSPEIEFDTNVLNLDLSKLKLRIVGAVPLTSCASDIDIQTSTTVKPLLNKQLPPGFYKENIGSEGISKYGWKSMISGVFWIDALTNSNTSASRLAPAGFVIYPWLRNGSLSNEKFPDKNGRRTSTLSKKKMSNLRFSYKTTYVKSSDIWYAETKEYPEWDTGISGAVLFNSEEKTLIKVPAPKNSGLLDINYYGNIDRVLTIPALASKKDGYPIVISGLDEEAITNGHALFVSDYKALTKSETDEYTSTDPVRIKYKSTPHAVIALNYDTTGALRVLPSIYDSTELNAPLKRFPVNSVSGTLASKYFFWDNDKKEEASVHQDILNSYEIKELRGDSRHSCSMLYGFLWMGELYNDNVVNRFGGNTEEALESNIWMPCGESVDIAIRDASGNLIPKESVTIDWTEGDTYYLRYDHIKTYPFTLEDLNAVTDIVSFMCETRINIDGRYDRNRGLGSNLAVTPKNFNKLNEVYSLDNNFFVYRTLNENKINLDDFHSTITWTKTKTNGALADNWTNITLASVLDLDGDKGPISSLKRLNNTLFAFLHQGLSLILYNENILIASTEGVPIEIANSGKVLGKRYISDSVGCLNKWAITESPYGIYFIDNLSKDIYQFNGKLTNLSDKYGFHSWITSKIKDSKMWTPDNDSIVTYYDRLNGDILFKDKLLCLAFSEPLGLFSSFYDYQNASYFINMENKGLFLTLDATTNTFKLWEQLAGSYNYIFDIYRPYYTTVVANLDIIRDKIFNTVEFRSDSYIGNNLSSSTFDTLTVWNEYLKGLETLLFIKDKPSNLKKKFRIWRANIPRNNIGVNGIASSPRDRIRNTWSYIKLSKEKDNKEKTILHDMTVHYTE